MSKRETPNPDSKILAESIIGGAGINIPDGSVNPPEGYAAVVLYVPINHFAGKDILQIQKDIGMPWAMKDKDGSFSGAWLDELA